MAVTPTSRSLLKPFAPRITDELPSPSKLLTAGGDGWEFILTFAPVLVRCNASGEEMTLPSGLKVVPDWIVDEALAYEGNPDNPRLWIKYGREACKLVDDADEGKKLVHALPVNGEGEGALPDGRRIKIYSQLPLCKGDPVKKWWQYRWPWIMRPVTVTSQIVLL